MAEKLNLLQLPLGPLQTNCYLVADPATRDAVVIEVGDRMPRDEIDYSDIDMLVRWVGGEERFVRKDGTPY